MTNSFDFGLMENDGEIEWPKRGRKARPLDPNLVAALHNSFGAGTTPNLIVRTDDVDRFQALLSRAGKELNYRIERLVKEDTPEPGYSTVYFKTRHKRKDEDDL